MEFLALCDNNAIKRLYFQHTYEDTGLRPCCVKAVYDCLGLRAIF